MHKLTVDANRWLGNTPNLQETDYFGIKVMMPVKVFLAVAEKLENHKASSIEFITHHLKSGNAIAPLFLRLRLPHDRENNRDKVAKVVGHEGRHRAMAIAALYGDDTTVETHIHFDGLRARHITEDDIYYISKEIGVEGQNKVISGKQLFTVI